MLMDVSVIYSDQNTAEDDDGDRDFLFPAELLYVQSFLQTFKREWTGIDRLRMDKFFQVKSSVLALRGGSLFFFETIAFVSLTAGSLHVQTNLPDAEEDQLGQQVTAGRPHTKLGPASLLSVCSSSAQCCFQVPGAAHVSAPAEQQRGPLWSAVPRPGPLPERAGSGGCR